VGGKKRKLAKPTPAELEILAVLWRRRSATVRQVREELERSRPIGYTTVLKLLQIMTEKGLVERAGEGRAHVYRPAAGREETQGRLVEDLVDKAFGGSASELVMRALSRRAATREELEEIRSMIEKFQRAGK
jgi:predicted transcriptional regulator